MLGAKVGLSSKQLRSSDSDPHNVSLTGGSSCNPGTDMGDGDTSYNAIHINDDGDIHDSISAYDADRNISTSTGNDGGSKVSFDIEMRHADENAMSRERRLTLRQLERFRRAMAKRSHRDSRTGGRWGNGTNQVASLDSVGLTSWRNSVWY